MVWIRYDVAVLYQLDTAMFEVLGDQLVYIARNLHSRISCYSENNG